MSSFVVVMPNEAGPAQRRRGRRISSDVRAIVEGVRREYSGAESTDEEVEGEDEWLLLDGDGEEVVPRQADEIDVDEKYASDGEQGEGRQEARPQAGAAFVAAMDAAAAAERRVARPSYRSAVTAPAPARQVAGRPAAASGAPREVKTLAEVQREEEAREARRLAEEEAAGARRRARPRVPRHIRKRNKTRVQVPISRPPVMVACPVCNESFKMEAMESHVDECLTQEYLRHAGDGASA